MDLTCRAGATARTDLDAADTYQGPAVLLPSGRTWTKASEFRARRLTETIRLDHRGEWEYLVKVDGPVQTTKGRDHAGQSESRTYGQGYGVAPLAEFPAALRPYLHGRAALLAELRGVVGA